MKQQLELWMFELLWIFEFSLFRFNLKFLVLNVLEKLLSKSNLTLAGLCQTLQFFWKSIFFFTMRLDWTTIRRFNLASATTLSGFYRIGVHLFSHSHKSPDSRNLVTSEKYWKNALPDHVRHHFRDLFWIPLQAETAILTLHEKYEIKPGRRPRGWPRSLISNLKFANGVPWRMETSAPLIFWVAMLDQNLQRPWRRWLSKGCWKTEQ